MGAASYREDIYLRFLESTDHDIACTAPPAHDRSRFRALRFLDADRSSAWLPLYSPASKNLHIVHRTVGARPIAISCLGAFWTPADRARGCHCIHRHPKTCTLTEVVPSHSITSSASASKFGGSSRPIDFAGQKMRAVTSGGTCGAQTGSARFAGMKILHRLFPTISHA